MKDPEKILLVTLSNIGDAVLTLPVIGALREQYKGALIDVIVGPRAAEIFDSDPRINRAYIYDKSASPLAKLLLMLDIRKAGYDLAVDLRNSMLGLLSGAKVCSRPAKVAAASEARHKSEVHLDRLRELGIPAEYKPFPVWISKADEDKARLLLRDKGISDGEEIICVSPGARSHIKRWAEGSFAKACDLLAAEYKTKFVFIGDDPDKQICQRIIGMMRHYAVSTAGQTNLRQLAWIIKRSSLLITNDSAPLHIASSFKTPVVAIFGPTDPVKYGPRPESPGAALHKKLHCSPCEVAACKYNLECMKAVTAEEVFDTAKKVLDDRREKKV
ncbi:MAG: glycosyltransferase family 9 protein [Candidatus Omnitrophota bacterium]